MAFNLLNRSSGMAVSRENLQIINGTLLQIIDINQCNFTDGAGNTHAGKLWGNFDATVALHSLHKCRRCVCVIRGGRNSRVSA